MWAHLGLFYGFLGLTAATTGAFLYTQVFPRLGIDHHGGVLSLPIWDPVKIVGNVGGVALLAGLAQTMWVRLKRPQQSGKSAYSDWFFSGLLGLTAVTGFVTEILRYAQARTAAYVVLRRAPRLHLRAVRLFPVLQVLAPDVPHGGDDLRPPDRPHGRQEGAGRDHPDHQ